MPPASFAQSRGSPDRRAGAMIARPARQRARGAAAATARAITNGEREMESSVTAGTAREGLALDAATLCEAFQRTADTHAGALALRTLGGGTEITWEQYATRVRRVAAGLRAAGVRRGGTVAIMLANRPETVIVDTAAMHLGAIPFSIYNTSSAEQIEYLFAHAECRLVVTEGQCADAVMAVAGRLEGLERVYLADGAAPGARPLAELEAGGSEDFDLEEALGSIAAEDVATLIYTSGTTGPPKAVELTHANLLAEMRMLDEWFAMRPAGRVVSYLPMAHLADRCASHHPSLASGAAVTFVADITQVLGAVIEVRPTAWGAVPRIWEKLKAALEAGFAAEPDEQRRAAVARALEVATEAVRAEQAGAPVAAEL